MRTLLISSLIGLLCFANLVMAQSSSPGENNQGEVTEEKLSIKVVLPKRCMFGDFDAIRQDMIWAGKKEPKILVSIVSADGEREFASEILAKMKTEKDPQELAKYIKSVLEDGVKTEIALDQTGAPKLFFLQVCKDTSDSNSCRGKQIRDINKILADYKNPKSNFVSGDHIYFYQPIVIGNTGVHLAEATLNLKKDLLDLLAKHSISAPANLTQQFNTLLTLQSFSLELEDGHVIIKLPIFDSLKCGQATK
jgi:hypothetical protein